MVTKKGKAKPRCNNVSPWFGEKCDLLKGHKGAHIVSHEKNSVTAWTNRGG